MVVAKENVNILSLMPAVFNLDTNEQLVPGPTL